MYHEDPIIERVVHYIENRHSEFSNSDLFLRDIVYDTLREYRKLAMQERTAEMMSRGYQKNDV